MIQRISSISIGQTAKVVGVLYAIMGLVFIPVFLLIALFAPGQSGMGLGMAVALPFVYGIAGFVFTAIGCAVYNFVANRIGGIEFRVLPTDGTASVSQPGGPA